MDVLRHSHCKPEGSQLRRGDCVSLILPLTGSAIDIRHKATPYRAYPDDSDPVQLQHEAEKQAIVRSDFFSATTGVGDMLSAL